MSHPPQHARSAAALRRPEHQPSLCLAPSLAFPSDGGAWSARQWTPPESAFEVLAGPNEVFEAKALRLIYSSLTTPVTHIDHLPHGASAAPCTRVRMRMAREGKRGHQGSNNVLV